MRQQRRDHVVGVGRLGQIVDRADLHRVDRGGDIAVAGQDDAARFGPAALERRDDIEAVAVAEPHVDHREGRRRLLDLAQSLGDRFGGRDGEAARFHAPPGAAGTTCRPRRSVAMRSAGMSLRASVVAVMQPRYPTSSPMHKSRITILSSAQVTPPIQTLVSCSAELRGNASAVCSKSARSQRTRTTAPCSGERPVERRRASRPSVPAGSWR